MKNIRFKDIFTFVCTLFVVVSTLTIICTFLTMYQFIYVDCIFNNYLALQVVMSITMFLCALRFFFYRKGRERLTYSAICMIIAIILVFFIVNKVS